MQKMMFNDQYGLTEALLDGRKYQTRRICKVQRPSDEWRIVLPISEHLIKPECLPNAYAWRNDKTEEYTDWCVPRYKVGEVVAISQSYRTVGNEMIHKDLDFNLYKNFRDTFIHKSNKGWDNKMFVRADLMPHQIQITKIRLERLQDISDEDCIAEGIMKGDFSNTWDKYYYNVIGDCICHKTFKTPKEAFASLIDKVSGKGTWKSNPYVFVYEFKLIE